ncbi:Hypothetical protein BROD_0627 [Brucella sp. NF 2653]|nr:Hypothetical protein BIBO1_1191 [Brucella inopinata BO1]EFM58243.1 Hypothetical protein BIBO2_2898 [Brucella sp. BO2]EFM63332.1 Hypothetical protein BROD_0627 [Brucella sp. NF 2653]
MFFRIILRKPASHFWLENALEAVCNSRDGQSGDDRIDYE